MSPSAKKLLEEALHLGEGERATLAGALIESLHGPAEIVEEAWERVIERRVRELEAGSAETVPGRRSGRGSTVATNEPRWHA